MLSDSEKLMWLFEKESPTHLQVIVRLVGKIQGNLLRQSLSILQKRHPLLNVRIIGRYIPRFDSLLDNNPIPLIIMVKKNNSQWMEIARQELNKPLPVEEGPLARAVLIGSRESSELIITFHHVICDGISLAWFIYELLALVESLQSKKALKEKGITYEESKSLDDMLPNTKINLDCKNNNISDWTSSLKMGSNSSEDNSSFVKKQCKFVYRILNQIETKNLIQRCKDKKMSVHDAICASLILALYDKVTSNISKELEIYCNTVVNMRRYLRYPINVARFGYLVSSIFTNHKMDRSKGFWNIAQEVHGEIGSYIAHNTHIKAIQNCGAILKKYQTADAFRKAARLSNPIVSISNIGNLNFCTKFDSFKLNELHFIATGHDAITTTFGKESSLFVVAQTIVDRLILDFLYSDSLWTDDGIETISNNVVVGLTKL